MWIREKRTGLLKTLCSRLQGKTFRGFSACSASFRLFHVSRIALLRQSCFGPIVPMSAVHKAGKWPVFTPAQHTPLPGRRIMSFTRKQAYGHPGQVPGWQVRSSRTLQAQVSLEHKVKTSKHWEYSPHNKHEYKPGTIIWAKDIATKTRPAIVIEALDTSFTIVPMFTNKGAGLADKPPRYKNEYMSVHDHRNAEWSDKQNEMPVLKTQSMKGSRIRGESTVHFAEEYRLDYSHNTKLWGQLNEDSTRILLLHCRPCAARAA